MLYIPFSFIKLHRNLHKLASTKGFSCFRKKRSMDPKPKTPEKIDPEKATVLVTGGGGYIGSHLVLQLLENGNPVVVVDNCSNCYKAEGRYMPESIHRVQELTGKSVKFIPLDIVNKDELEMAFLEYNIDCVMHLAGLKAVAESGEKPLEYYKNNIGGSISLLQVMNTVGVNRLIFSSSATVYGSNEKPPFFEHTKTGNCTNPYGWTKFMIETILDDMCKANKKLKVISLRYFNPVGAHESGVIGEDPRGRPTNLMPIITRVAVKKLPEIKVFGNDYDTRDGTGVRDYIHVMDLVEAHIKALEKILKDDFEGFKPYNIGTGNGQTVLEMIRTFAQVSSKAIPYTIGERRPGDVAASYCDCSLANKELQWVAKKSLIDMCKDSWKWQELNPEGYLKVTRKGRDGYTKKCPTKDEKKTEEKKSEDKNKEEKKSEEKKDEEKNDDDKKKDEDKKEPLTLASIYPQCPVAKNYYII